MGSRAVRGLRASGAAQDSRSPAAVLGGARELAVHVPVLVDEVAFLLRPRGAGWIIDGTVGMGGHAEAMLSGTGPDVRLLGLDRDPEALRRAAHRLAPFADRVRLAHASFRDVADVARTHGVTRARAILLDLGMSSYQIEESARGFTFQAEEPLDMRLDPGTGEPAAALLNRLPED
ncbi:MAG TPA: 16S rRNA (cytosine(1402)-N(4))-methyltransferase, partial [Methylomirabilota bacterium]|nr:16S rRNA (cytosine(1402)-N(4))-methyltransferase [Methylomirabilota bacterium]